MMKASRQLRFTFLALFSLCVVVALSSCSKKDVKQDEPGFATGDGAAAKGEGSVGAGGAGDVGVTSGDLKTVFFAFDSFTLGGEARSQLKDNAKWLKDNASASIQIEGHCDERGTTEYNLALGERRANAAKSYLKKLGIDSSRVSTISYGKERPLDAGHDESAWSKNRRAAFVVLSH